MEGETERGEKGAHIETCTRLHNCVCTGIHDTRIYICIYIYIYIYIYIWRPLYVRTLPDT